MFTPAPFHSSRVRCSLAATLAIALTGCLAAGAQASTIAYTNANDGNVYVADSTGANATEVASGVSSPSLAPNGDLYALNAAGNAVAVYVPGAGLTNTIPISGSGATQLAVSPNEASLAFTDGFLLDPGTTQNILTVAPNTTQTIAGGENGHWTGSGRLAVSVLPASGFGDHAAIVSSNKSVLTNWLPNLGLGNGGIAQELVLEYAPNPSGTLAAAVVTLVGLHIAPMPELIVFPINPLTLGPTGGNPIKTNAFCPVDPSNYAFPPGNTVAWSPNGSALAYDSATGISEVTVGKWTAGNCSAVIGAPNVVIPNGYQPSWGASDNRNY
jgi:hypothetical protein